MARVAAGRGEGRTFSDHLAEHPDAAALLDAVRAALVTIGPADEVVSRSEAVFEASRLDELAGRLDSGAGRLAESDLDRLDDLISELEADPS